MFLWIDHQSHCFFPHPHILSASSSIFPRQKPPTADLLFTGNPNVLTPHSVAGNPAVLLQLLRRRPLLAILSRMKALPMSTAGCFTLSTFHCFDPPIKERYDRLFSGNRSSPCKLCRVIGTTIVAQAHKKSRGKARKEGTLSTNKKAGTQDKSIEEAETSSKDDSTSYSVDKISDSVNFPPRGSVIQACVVTSGFLSIVGIVLRQASHSAFVEGWLKSDSAEISFGFVPWHLELILGLVVLVSACRYLLLRTWPDFAESSDAANKQVLSSLEPLDLVLVSFLPGISEELLFRGALMPLFGLNWQSALAVGAIFGGLHLGNGRKYSFAIWAAIVGFAYGLAATVSSSVVVPMAAHSLNNLVGGILWQQESKKVATK